RRRQPGQEGRRHDRRRCEDGLDRRRQGLRASDQRIDPHPHRRDGRVGGLKATTGELLTAGGRAAAARLRRTLREPGLADPAGAARNLEALTPTPRDAELLAPAFTRLLSELAAAPDPDMALNNLERYAEVVDRSVFFGTLAEHPGATPLLARVLGSSQVLADALRRRPSNLAWLLEPATKRLWFAQDLAACLALTLGAFQPRGARMNAQRRFNDS